MKSITSINFGRDVSYRESRNSFQSNDQLFLSLRPFYLLTLRIAFFVTLCLPPLSRTVGGITSYLTAFDLWSRCCWYLIYSLLAVFDYYLTASLISVFYSYLATSLIAVFFSYLFASLIAAFFYSYLTASLTLAGSGFNYAPNFFAFYLVNL